MQTYSVTQIEKLLKLHAVHTFAIFNPPKYHLHISLNIT